MVNVPVNAGCAVAGIFVALAAAWLTPGKGRTVAHVGGAIAGLLFLNGLSVMYASTDADFYHMPALRLLAAGWNPFHCVGPEALKAAFPESGVSSFGHIAFLPKGSWLFGAALFKLFGYAEAGNVLVMILAAVLFPVARALLSTAFGITGRWGIAFALSLTLSPWVIDTFFDARNDGSLYACLVISAAAAQLFLKTRHRRWLLLACLPLPLLASLKFSGAVSCAVIALVGLIAGGGRRWFAACTATACVALLIGSVSYLPLWRTYGSPVYPVLAADVHPGHILTSDFTDMNPDAAAMGYPGRFIHAYYTSSLTRAFYAWKTDRPDFKPIVRVAEGNIDGLGIPFRLLMLAATIGWFAGARKKKNWPLAAMLFVSVLPQPSLFVGYARYVPQLYAFAVLGTLCLPFKRVLACANLALQAACCAIPIAWLFWKAMLSYQNLAVIDAFPSGEAAVKTDLFNIREGFRDYGIATHPPQPGDIETVISGSMLYSVWRAPEAPDPGIPPVRMGFEEGTEYLKPRSEKLRQNIAHLTGTFIPWAVCSTPRLSLTLLKMRWQQLTETR